LLSFSGPAFAQTGPVSVAPGHSPIQRIDDSVSLPGGWLAVRRDGADDLFLISGDGRYVVQPAQMVDTQTGRALRDYPSVAASVRDPVLARLDGVWDDLRPVDRGEGAHDVIVFTDPHCPYCKALIAELAAYRDTVRVRVVEVPILGQASNPLVVEAFCAADPAAGSDAVFGVGPARRSGANRRLPARHPWPPPRRRPAARPARRALPHRRARRAVLRGPPR
jgi:protein-disulfide isomerase